MHSLTAVACIVGFAIPALAAQQRETEAAFDVASIRRNASHDQQGSGLSAPQPGGRYIALGVTLRRLIQDAYGMQVVGGPAWIDADRFDVNAKAEGEPGPAEILRMLRPLLADRFALEVHTEQRDTAVYVLRLARPDGKLGDGLRESEAQCAAEARKYFPGQIGFPPPCGDFRLAANELVARGMTLDRLANVLDGPVGRPVLNRTGVDAAFDLTLEWTSSVGLTPFPRGAAGAETLSPDGVSLFTALQEQLGLRLEATRAPVDILVVDRVEVPTLD